jgi:CRP/FNR family transcriptional regulator, cyclic AMP receptor protein
MDATRPRRIRLLEFEPDLARFLAPDERADVRPLSVPVLQVLKGEDGITVRGIDRNAFGALVLDGMLLQRFRFGDHETMRPIGPGDLLSFEEPRTPNFLAADDRTATADTRLAVLGSDFLAAARRWPGLVAGLHVRAMEQVERVCTQLAICQLPRVADRLLAMMWLLAESWGRVTPSGVTLPLVVTHEALGAFIGARRPTVSLAVAELIERGAVVRQQTGWLLLEELPAAGPRAPRAEAPELTAQAESPWIASCPPRPVGDGSSLGSELLDTVQRLRDSLDESREHVDNTLEQVRRSRERIRLARARRAGGTFTR